MKAISLCILSAALFAGVNSCGTHSAAPSGSETAIAQPSTAGDKAAPVALTVIDLPTTGTRSITLPVMDTELPAGPGRLTLMSACTLCHSPRYVTMQPKFSKKKWTDEVDKMKKVYGAPIQDEQVEPIVKYLVSIRGNGQ